MTVNECAEALKRGDDFLILTHARPDGDTLGSAAALCSALRRCGKRAVLYKNSDVTPHVLWMVEPFFGEAGAAPFVVSVDVAGERLFPPGFADGEIDLCVDHHPGEHGFAKAALLEPGKASCGEIVMELIEALGAGVTPEEASLLYVAVSTDCGCFVYGNTTAETHRAAARLIELGAEHHRLNKDFFRSMSFSRLKLEGMVFSTLRSYRGNQLNVAVVTREMMEVCGATEDDCDDLANLAGRVRGNRVAITVRELSPGKSKASLRTDGSVDAAALCARFGGGGHKMAAGCTMAAEPDALAEILRGAVETVWPG